MCTSTGSSLNTPLDRAAKEAEVGQMRGMRRMNVWWDCTIDMLLSSLASYIEMVTNDRTNDKAFCITCASPLHESNLLAENELALTYNIEPRGNDFKLKEQGASSMTYFPSPVKYFCSSVSSIHLHLCTLYYWNWNYMNYYQHQAMGTSSSPSQSGPVAFVNPNAAMVLLGARVGDECATVEHVGFGCGLVWRGAWEIGGMT